MTTCFSSATGYISTFAIKPETSFSGLLVIRTSTSKVPVYGSAEVPISEISPEKILPGYASNLTWAESRMRTLTISRSVRFALTTQSLPVEANNKTGCPGAMISFDSAIFFNIFP